MQKVLCSLFIQNVRGQNSMGASDDFARIAIAPTIPEAMKNIPRGTQDLLLGKMRQIIGLNGMSALDDAPLFIMTPQLMVLSNDVTPTAPPMYTYSMEVVFNMADRYTGNVYATASQTVKGVGKTEQAAYNAAFNEINIRNGKYKVMMEKGKTAIVEYFNSNCDLVISRGKSLADQRNWVAALGLLNSVPPVCRECFDKANEVAGEIGRNMPVIITVESKAIIDKEPEYTGGQTIDIGNKIFLRFKTWGEGSWQDHSKPGALHEANLLKLDISKAKSQLGWSPLWNIDKAIAETVAWYQHYQTTNIYDLCCNQITDYMKLSTQHAKHD